MNLHGYMSNYENSDLYPMIDSMHFYPAGAAHVNRMGLPIDIDLIPDTVNARYSRMSESPVKIEILSISYDPATRMSTVVVKSTAVQPNMSGLYRINAAITESNLVGYQQNFPECPGGNAYNHKFVLRTLKFNPVGDYLVDGNWGQQTALTRTISVELDDKWIASNCDVVIYIDRFNGTLNNSEIQQAVVQGVTRPLGMEKTESASSAILNVFPNPVHGMAHIHVRISTEGNVNAGLFDMNGKRVKIVTDQKLSAGFYNMEFNTSDLPAGSYIFRMETNQQVYSTQIQIQ